MKKKSTFNGQIGFEYDSTDGVNEATFTFENHLPVKAKVESFKQADAIAQLLRKAYMAGVNNTKVSVAKKLEHMADEILHYD